MGMKKRMFLGLPLDEEAERGVGKIVERLQKKRWKVRWETPSKWHVTLAFLGEVQWSNEIPVFSGPSHLARSNRDDTAALNSLAAVSSAVRQAVSGVGPFEVRLKGVDVFPRQQLDLKFGERWHGNTMRRVKVRQKPTVVLPKIIYVRLGGDLQAMQRLVRHMRVGLRAKGIEHDEKPFMPHITIGRVMAECGRAEKVEIGKTVGKLYEMDIPQQWRVERVVLYESELLPTGSRYRVVEEWQFSGNVRFEPR